MARVKITKPESTAFIDATHPQGAPLPTVTCPGCNGEVDLNKAEKIGPGTYQCTTEDCNRALGISEELKLLPEGESDQIGEPVVSKRRKIERTATDATVVRTTVGDVGATRSPVTEIPGIKMLASMQSITVSWGPEKIGPKRYQFVDVGPFEYTTTVQPEETVEQAYERANELVTTMGERERAKRVASLLWFLKSVNIGDE